MERPVFKQSRVLLFLSSSFLFCPRNNFSQSDSRPATSQKISRRLHNYYFHPVIKYLFRGRVCMGRVCMVRDLVAELVMGRVCYGQSLSWAEFVMGRDVPESNILTIWNQPGGSCISGALSWSAFLRFVQSMQQFVPRALFKMAAPFDIFSILLGRIGYGRNGYRPKWFWAENEQ